MAAEMYAPGSGEAIMNADQGIGALHTSGRRTVNAIGKLAKAKQGADYDNAVINFGDSFQQAKQDANQSKKLLRDVKSAVTQPAPQTNLT